MILTSIQTMEEVFNGLINLPKQSQVNSMSIKNQTIMRITLPNQPSLKGHPLLTQNSSISIQSPKT